ncbi:MAG TPA: pseudouridine-5'-phosphate glycosidase [Gemmataceae bacterium]|jgi:pseudouridine-5'-phosphate glycosidase|nr:pseudouridine-5'-phosphate glycosidase [Gemmataceae bacterium]
MNTLPHLEIRPDIAAALKDSRPVVALESTLISHGLPWPINLETARAAEKAVHDEGAVPATIAVLRGRPTVGLTETELEELAKDPGVLKASRRDLAGAVALGRTAATTVAATMLLAHQAGIRILATGGIGGAHRPPANAWDISADLVELARTPVAVLCSGAKSILDIPRTLEILETLGVPVIGYGTDEFPAFYVRSSGEPLSCRVDATQDVAKLCLAHWNLGGAGLVIAQPAPEKFALSQSEMDKALFEAEDLARKQGVRGPAITPFLLSRLSNITKGKTLMANQALVVENARLAARLANFIGAV